MFSKIVHWSGIVLAKALGFIHKADTDVEKAAPEIEKALTEGATVADFIPGIGPEIAAGLNLGSELTGALEKTLNFADADFQKLVNQLESTLPANSGMSVVLIPSTLKSDAQEFFAQIKPTLDAVKAQAEAITGKSGAPAAKTSATAAPKAAANTGDPKVITTANVETSPK